ncbi:hypothetical protein AAH991_15405 [Microbispora sp. ZYX-F-249]|uniref:Uncharacterized protein n=1 Tax=Microbispora maris TaxID=3144104 RepID=A0ABV0AQE0_9ACTN
MTEDAATVDQELIDYQAIRQHFPLGWTRSHRRTRLLKTYRDVIAGARVRREIIEAIEKIRRSA